MSGRRGARVAVVMPSAQAAASHVRQRRRRAGRHDRYAAGDEIDHAGRGTLVRHVQHLRAGLEHEELHRQVRGGADAGGCVHQLAGARLRERDQLLRRAHRERRMHDEQVGLPDALRDRGEIAQSIVRQRLVNGWIDRQSRQSDQQRVTVRGRLGHYLRAYDGGCAGARIDDNGLAEALGERRRDDAGQRVGGAAGGARRDDAQRLGGPWLRARRRGERAAKDEG